MNIDFDTRKLEKDLKKLGDNLDFNVALNKSGIHMIGETVKNIKQQKTVDGQKMKPFKDTTVAGTSGTRYYLRKTDGKKTWKKRASSYLSGGNVRYSASSKLIQDSGNLMQGVDFKKKAKTFIIIGVKGLAAKYADAQNAMRQFIGINNKNEKTILGYFKEQISKAINKAGF